MQFITTLYQFIDIGYDIIKKKPFQLFMENDKFLLSSRSVDLQSRANKKEF